MSRYTLTSNSMIFEFKWIEWNYINFRWFVVEPLIPISLSIVNCDHPVKHLLWMENKQCFYYQSRVHGFGMFWHETSQAKTGPRVNTFLQDKLHGAGLNLGVIILQHMERLPPKFNENSNSLCRRNLIFGQQYVVLWTEFLSCCGVSPRSIFARSWWAKPGFLFRPWMPLDLFDFRPWHSLIPPLSLLQWSASHWSSVQSVPGCVWGRNFETR